MLVIFDEQDAFCHTTVLNMLDAAGAVNDANGS
jgi:hypothetical protein